MGKITISGKGRRWLLTGHPWIYKDDVAGGEAEPGELVPVEDPAGKVIGWGTFSSSSRIAVRLVTNKAEQPNRAFWLERLRRSVEARPHSPEGAARLVAGDADGLPGFLVDRYADVAVLQCSTQGADRMRDFLVELLEEVMPTPLAVIHDRSDMSVRRLEELEPRVETLKGELPERVVVQEPGLEYTVDVREGHKTGAYLDQVQNRLRAATRAQGRSVLDAFSYDGLFGVRAALAGATEVVCLDQNQAALDRARDHAERNGVGGIVRVDKVNCMGAMRERAEAGEIYGLIIVDPPAFARNKKEAEGAERGYVELNRRALAMAEPGGHIVSASCSYNVRSAEFVSHLRKASVSADRSAVIEELHGAAFDHPQLLTLPEAAYLKCAFLRVGS